MLRSRFDRDLRVLNNQLLEVGLLLETSLESIVKVLKDYDMESFKSIEAAEEEVDKLTRKIERHCLKILYRHQPVAVDLRKVSSALNMITDMERISDQTLDISEIAMLFRGRDIKEEPRHIVEMVSKCIKIVNKSVTSFINKDVDLAKEVVKDDDHIDELFLCVRDEVISIIYNDKKNVEQAIDYLMIAKYLERIADHAVNISEWVIFNITGEYKNSQLI